ncbi:MAG: hypothetical protein ABIG43_03795 [Chloroflexota bacterium]
MNRCGISFKDMSRLSAYIDGCLSDKERDKFEVRLAGSKELQHALIKQKRLKAALRALPVKPAPRNFTLNPEMVAQRKSQPKLMLTFRFASAAAALLLIAVFAGELLLGSLFPSPQASMMASEAALSDEAAVVADEPMIIFWNSTAEGKGGGEEAIGIGGGLAETMIEAAPEEIGRVPESEESAIPPVEEPLIAVIQEEASLESDTAPGLISPEADPEILILGLRPEEGGDVISQSGSGQDVSSKMINLSPIRWIEIGLGVLALGLGITAIVLRSKQRKIR